MAMFETLFGGSAHVSRPSLFATARKMADVRRQRLALKRMSDAELSDIGLTRAQAEREATRSVWDVPHTWRF